MMLSDLVGLFVLCVGLLVLYRYVIPYLFPAALEKEVVVVSEDGAESRHFVMRSSASLMNVNKRSHVKADVRRRKRAYEEAVV